MCTVEFLERHRDLWTLGDVGEFVLTGGSFVARDPARYGLAAPVPRPGHDIHRSLLFTDPVRLTDAEQATLRRRKRSVRVADLDRPWLGGVDTPHSYFYHARYGRGLGRLIARDRAPARLAEHAAWHLNGMLVRPPAGTDLAAAGSGLALRPATTGRLFVLRRDGTAFLCPPDLPAALPSQSDVDPPVDLAALSRRTCRALLANRLISPDPTTQQEGQ